MTLPSLKCIFVMYHCAAHVAHAVSLQSGSIQGVASTPSRAVSSSDKLFASPDRLTIDDLWAGTDGNASSFRGLIDVPRSVSLSVVAQLQIAGMYDTGTNLLGALLEANLGTTKMRQVCPGSISEGYHCHWWKHAAPESLNEQLDTSARMGKHITLVALVRSPLAHISSWIKASYDMESCVNAMDLEHDQETFCTLPPSVGGGNFTGLTGVWNDFVRGYHEQAKRSDRNVVLVEYERLVYDPESVIREIVDALGIRLEGSFNTVEKAAKDDHGAHGRQQALKEIAEMGYVNRPPMTNLAVKQALCGNLDERLMLSHGVMLPSENRTYAADCD